MAGDRIHLRGVRCRCRVGVPAWERKKPQKILLNAALTLNLAPAGRTDDLKSSVDYFALEGALRTTAESKPYKLLEALAESLAQTILRFDRRIRSVTLTVSKKPAVMPKTGAVVIEITRKR